MPASPQPQLSIIIVNWNSADYLHECLPSIVAADPGVPFEVIVVDNASTRDDLDTLVADFPWVRLIRSESNLGFSGANNLGFRHSTGEYVLFLNPDTRIIPPALSLMLQALRKTPAAGMIGCRLLNSDLTLQTSCVQRFPTGLNQALAADILYKCFPRLGFWGKSALHADANTPIPVEVISGACLMMRRQVFEQVGLFSEEYFMYAEDVDLCHKVAQANLHCCYLGAATIVHYGGGSSSQTTVSAWSAVARYAAILQFLVKTRGVAYAGYYRMAIAASALGRMLAVAPLLICGHRFQRSRARGTIEKWTAILQWALRPHIKFHRPTAAAGQAGYNSCR